MSFTAASAAYNNGFKFWGTAYVPGAVPELSRIVWVFYVSKIYEFVDTLIMLAKGSLRQVSFLHVYHHVTISAIWCVHGCVSRACG